MGLEIGIDRGGTSNGGTGGTIRPDIDATVLPWDRGRAGLGLLLRREDDRMPAGKEATGRCSALRDRFPAVRGRPLSSTEGRGPSLTFCLYTPVRSRSFKDGLAD